MNNGRAYLITPIDHRVESLNYNFNILDYNIPIIANYTKGNENTDYENSLEKLNNNNKFLSDNEFSCEYIDDEEYNINEHSNMHEKYASETDECRIYTENKSTQINGINEVNTQMEQGPG